MPAVFLRQLGVDSLVVGKIGVAAVKGAKVMFKRCDKPLLLFAELAAPFADNAQDDSEGSMVESETKAAEPATAGAADPFDM